MPRYMQSEHELVYRDSPRNPGIELSPSALKAALHSVKQYDLAQAKNPQPPPHPSLNSTQVRTHIRTAMKTKLLRNALSLEQKTTPGGSSVQLRCANEILSPSAAFKHGLQEYNIKESGYNSLKNHATIPQKAQHSYDCILNTSIARQPPPIPVELNSSYHDQYFLQTP